MIKEDKKLLQEKIIKVEDMKRKEIESKKQQVKDKNNKYNTMLKSHQILKRRNNHHQLIILRYYKLYMKKVEQKQKFQKMNQVDLKNGKGSVEEIEVKS